MIIHIFLGEEKVEELRLPDTLLTIGRDPGCDLFLNGASVSREHAQIEPSGEYFVIRDRESTNGTFLNEHVIHAEILHPGDTISIGSFKLTVQYDQQRRPDTTKVTIETLPPNWLEEGTNPAAKKMFRQGLSPDEAVALEARDRLLRLYSIQQELGHVDNVPSLLDRALECMLRELGADRGCVLAPNFSEKDHVEDFDDEGPGIPESEQETVFQVFHQIDEQRSGETPGLGLSVARQIIQEIGGDVQITSPFGFRDRGARVTVLLPIYDSGRKKVPSSTDVENQTVRHRVEQY